MNHTTIAPRPAFAANIALVTPYQFRNIIQHFDIEGVCLSNWKFDSVDQFKPSPCSYTAKIFNCLATVFSNKSIGKISHIDTDWGNGSYYPENGTYFKDAKKLFNWLKRHFLQGTKSCVVVGGLSHYKNSNSSVIKESQKIYMDTIKQLGVDASYFLDQDNQLYLGYIGEKAKTHGDKSLGHLKDTVYIVAEQSQFTGPKNPKFPQEKNKLIDFLNIFFGNWHVSKNDKLVWVNEHLCITDPKFIEEIPRKLYDKHA